MPAEIIVLIIIFTVIHMVATTLIALYVKRILSKIEAQDYYLKKIYQMECKIYYDAEKQADHVEVKKEDEKPNPFRDPETGLYSMKYYKETIKMKE